MKADIKAKIKKSISIAYFLTAVMTNAHLFLACSGSSSPDAQIDIEEPQQEAHHLTLHGFAQGPLQEGSSIQMYELDAALNQTGISFQTEVANDLGEYHMPVKLRSSYIELFALGYFLDELATEQSGGWLKLDCIADTGARKAININILTTLAKSRIVRLTAEGQTFDQAHAQSRREVLNAFGITDEVTTLFEDMNLLEAEEGNAELLAVTSIVLQMAHYKDDIAVSAALSELIEKIGGDLQDNGLIDNVAMHEDVSRAILKIRPLKINADLSNRFSGMDIPHFEKVIDRLVHEYAYNHFAKYLVSIRCVTDCSNIQTPLYNSLLEQSEFVMIVDDEGSLMGTYADNEGKVSGIVYTDGNAYITFSTNYAVSGEALPRLNGDAMISDGGMVTGLVDMYDNNASSNPQASLDGQVY